MKNVLMVGTWHLGSVIGACLAEANNKVYLWDQNARIAEKWRAGEAPIHEPGLTDLIQKHWKKTLFWTEDLGQAVKSADWICLTYDTPINDQDEVQLASVEEGLSKVLASGFSNHCNFFFTAQIPVGTSARLRKRIVEANPRWAGHVLYQPENLRLSEAIRSFQNPDRAVLGIDSDDPGVREKLLSEFRALTQNSHTPMQLMSLASAEMVKHAMNSFLATCVVFANELAEICEKTGADAWDVAASMKTDSRVGPKAFLRPGLGFAGGTLARDVKTLSKLLPKDDNFFAQLYETNTHRNDWVLKVLKEMLGSLTGKRVVLLGVTYKPGTSTVRRSPAVDIAALLKKAGATCVALDPMADLDELAADERRSLAFSLETSAEVAFANADAAVLVTEWPEFKQLDLAKLGQSMHQKVLVDTKNFLVKEAQGFQIQIPGKA